MHLHGSWLFECHYAADGQDDSWHQPDQGYRKETSNARYEHEHPPTRILEAANDHATNEPQDAQECCNYSQSLSNHAVWPQSRQVKCQGSCQDSKNAADHTKYGFASSLSQPKTPRLIFSQSPAVPKGADLLLPLNQPLIESTCV